MNDGDVTETNNLNSLDKTINDRGYFERLLKEREKFDEERDRRIEERFDAIEQARSIQAEEYARRLHDLNGEYKRDRDRQSDYVRNAVHQKDIDAAREDIARIGTAVVRLEKEALSREHYDTAHKVLEDRVTKLDREKLPTDKFDDRETVNLERLKQEAEARDKALARVDEKFEEYVKRYEVRQREVDLLLSAQKGAADQAIRAAEEQGRKANRNLGIASLALGVVVFAANILPSIIK